MTKTQERPRRQDRRNGKCRYDSALIEAKTKNKRVELTLALPTHLTDHDGFVTVIIREVDTYSIKVSPASEAAGSEHWISKAFIVQATIL